MWLEELVWLWGSIVGGVSCWGVWSLVSLKTELKALRQRLAQLEDMQTKRYDNTKKVA